MTALNLSGMRLHETEMYEYVRPLELAFVDCFMFQKLESASAGVDNDNVPTDTGNNGKYSRAGDQIPRFEEWAAVNPGDICVKAKGPAKCSLAAEIAMPVIGCAICMPEKANADFEFAGIAFDKSVRLYEDGRGPQAGEFFQMRIDGMATIINSGKDAICPGELVEWSFDDDSFRGGNRHRDGPRRIIARSVTSSTGSYTYSCVFGVAKTRAKRGERLDVRLLQKESLTMLVEKVQMVTTISDARSAIEANEAELETAHVQKADKKRNAKKKKKAARRLQEVPTEVQHGETSHSTAAASEELCCAICMDGRSNHAMIPCGHVCTCSMACARTCGSNCPICRESIVAVYPIFIC